VTKNTVAITVNGTDVVVDNRREMAYAALCGLANMDPKSVPSILYFSGPLWCGVVYSGEAVPLKRGAAYDVRIDPTL